MTDLYILFESGIDENEWWFLQAFADKEDALKCAKWAHEDAESSKYRIVKYKAEKIIFEI